MRASSNKRRKSFLRMVRFILRNPILMGGFSVTFAVMATTHFADGLALSLAFCILQIPVSIFAVTIARWIPARFRMLCNVLLTSALYAPALLAVRALFPQSELSLSIYLPLLVVNELILQKAEVYASHGRIKHAFLDMLGSMFGFIMTILLISFVREIFGYGTILGHSIGLSWTFFPISLPFMGLVLVGLIAAVVQKVYISLMHRKRSKLRQSYNVKKSDAVWEESEDLFVEQEGGASS